MESFADYRRRMHAKGFVVPNSDRKAWRVPEEFRGFVGVVSDAALYNNLYDRLGKRDQLLCDPLLSVVELELVIGACGGSKNIVASTVRDVRRYGLRGLRGMTTDDFEGKPNYGRKRLDALVALGVRDTRVARQRTTLHIRGWFSGTVGGVAVSGEIDGGYRSSREL